MIYIYFLFSLGRVDELVVGEDVVATPHGESDAVLVVVEDVVGHVGPERLQHRQPRVAVVVHVVACVAREGEQGGGWVLGASERGERDTRNGSTLSRLRCRLGHKLP